jgi:hypothetical protein
MWLAVVGAIATAVGFGNVSGMVLSDWWNASAGRVLTSEQAVEVFRGVKEAPLLPLWDGTELFSLVGPLLVLAGLARAGVLGWWTMALLVGGVVGLMAFGRPRPWSRPCSSCWGSRRSPSSGCGSCIAAASPGPEPPDSVRD